MRNTSRELSKWRMLLAERARQVLKLLANVNKLAKDVNELEKTVSRLKNELTEDYKKIDEALDRKE